MSRVPAGQPKSLRESGDSPVASNGQEEEGELLSGWHLDKRVPLALLAAMLLQGAAILWWAAHEDQKITDHELRLARIEASDHEQAAVFTDLRDRLARMEVNITFLVKEQERQMRRAP